MNPFFAAIGATLGGFGRRLMGAGRAAKEKLGLGWVRNSIARALMVVLPVALVAFSGWSYLQMGVVAGAVALPWFTPYWGESTMNPESSWPRWRGFLVMLARFLVPAAAIFGLYGIPWLLVAAPLPAIAYFFCWHAPKYGTALAEVLAGAVWLAALGAAI